ncbi:hypothetical protein GCM10009117_25360 [Gangjinia marincola]|uniref:DUF2490 domain-containing protein n=2 Tax=Gangjinia marincola TaxID=578463 RepID=A0ABN1MKJ0_9FLAO
MCTAISLKAQEAETLPEESIYKDPVSKYWINTYGNIRVSKKLFWVAQTHFRFQETEDVPFAGQVAQVYNRHALGYIYDEKTNFALGGVLRLNANTNEEDDDKSLIPEWRIWHQYQFASKVGRAVMYNRFRIEHRWSKDFEEDSQFIFRNRWRYMFRLKIPINKPKITSKVFYVAPEAEIIMQSGEPVVASPLEDLRLHTSFGYIFSPQLTVATGLMYNLGQTLDNGGIYKQGWTIRMHLYFSPDFRKTENKLPEVHFRD